MSERTPDSTPATLGDIRRVRAEAIAHVGGEHAMQVYDLLVENGRLREALRWIANPTSNADEWSADIAQKALGSEG